MKIVQKHIERVMDISETSIGYVLCIDSLEGLFLVVGGVDDNEYTMDGHIPALNLGTNTINYFKDVEVTLVKSTELHVEY